PERARIPRTPYERLAGTKQRRRPGVDAPLGDAGVEEGVAGREMKPKSQRRVRRALESRDVRAGHVEVVRPGGRPVVIDQVAKALIKIRGAYDDRTEDRLFEPHFPAERMLRFQVRISVHESGREVLIEG